jgi:hypothetical protein
METATAIRSQVKPVKPYLAAVNVNGAQRSSRQELEDGRMIALIESRMCDEPVVSINEFMTALKKWDDGFLDEFLYLLKTESDASDELFEDMVWCRMMEEAPEESGFVSEDEVMEALRS